jgi:hypothetical protein
LALVAVEEVEGARELVPVTSVSDVFPGTHRGNTCHIQRVRAAAGAARAFDTHNVGGGNKF